MEKENICDLCRFLSTIAIIILSVCLIFNLAYNSRANSYKKLTGQELTFEDFLSNEDVYVESEINRIKRKRIIDDWKVRQND